MYAKEFRIEINILMNSENIFIYFYFIYLDIVKYIREIFLSSQDKHSN